MAYKKRIICISKIDILDEESINKFKKIAWREKNTLKMMISSVAQINIEELKHEMWKSLSEESI